MGALADGLARVHHSHHHFKTPLAKFLMIAAGLTVARASAMLKKRDASKTVSKEKDIIQRAAVIIVAVALMALACIVEIMSKN